MPEQKDLLSPTEDKTGPAAALSGGEEAGEAAQSAAATACSEGDGAPADPAPARVRQPADIAGGGIADGEVRAVESPAKAGALGKPLLLLVALLLVGGFFLLKSGSLPGPSKPTPAPVAVPQAGIKFPILRPVEEVVEPNPVAATASRAPAQPATPAPAATETTVAMPSPQQPPAERYAVLVGPFLNAARLAAAAAELDKLGFRAEPTKGRGLVSMIRLQEGVYPADQAHRRLAELNKTVGSAFLLPAGENLALYVGSFSDPARAAILREQLLAKGITVEPVVSEMEMDGKLLLALQGDLETARQAAETISRAGFHTQVK
jgi:hypothetical protein